MKQPVRRKIAEANGISNEKTIYTLIVDGNNLLKIGSKKLANFCNLIFSLSLNNHQLFLLLYLL